MSGSFAKQLDAMMPRPAPDSPESDGIDHHGEVRNPDAPPSAAPDAPTPSAPAARIDRTPSCRSIVVISHRGGCGKTALATGLALGLARRAAAAGRSDGTMLVDCAFAPTAAVLAPATRGDKRPAPWTGAPEPVRGWTHPDWRFEAVHAPKVLTDPAGFAALAADAAAAGFSRVVVDLPVCGPDELTAATRGAALLLVLVPCDGPAFRSLPPLLEALRDERARPGRAFQTRAVLTGTGVPNPERQAIEAYQRRYLAALLATADFPFDPALRRAMSKGTMSETEPGQPMSPATAALDALAAEVESLTAAAVPTA